MNNTETQTSSGNAPTHFAYQVSRGGQKSYWTRIGIAWTHKDGKGLNIVLDSFPVDGKVAICATTEEK